MMFNVGEERRGEGRKEGGRRECGERERAICVCMGHKQHRLWDGRRGRFRHVDTHGTRRDGSRDLGLGRVETGKSLGK